MMPSQRKTIYAVAAISVVSTLALVVSCSSVAKPAAATMTPPPSQLGTTPDGNIQAQGDVLLVDDALRRRFEYYLAGMDEQPLAQIKANADADLTAHLTAMAANQAKDLFGRYIGYRQALATAQPAPTQKLSGLAGARARLKAIRDMRPKFFSAQETKGLFSWIDAYDDDALARMEITQDSALSDSVKRQRLAELDTRAAPDIVASRQAPVRYLNLQKQVQEAREHGASDADVYRIRATSVGEEAAARLAAYDKAESDWQNRISAYKADRDAILTNPSLDTSARATAIQALRDGRFNANEQKRLPAYEK